MAELTLLQKMILKLIGGAVRKKMGNIIAFLQGRKTYLLSAIAILGAIVGYADNQLTLLQFIEAIMAALSISTLRAGISKSGPNNKPSQ